MGFKLAKQPFYIFIVMLKVEISSFSYNKKEVLKDIIFQLKNGEHLVVLGESGCGKSTLLHLIYGLLPLKNGNIHWGNKQLLGSDYQLIPGEDFIKLVAQEFNIAPFTTVAENIATFLSRQNLSKDKKRVEDLLELLDMKIFKSSIVNTLSGGQKQRVALGKALAKKPDLLLLDEPFSHIDNYKKNSLRKRLFSFLKEEQISCITATHDAEEALSFADKIMILKKGKVIRYDTPSILYNSLQTPYEASFFGVFSEIPKGIFSSKNKIVLPHQLQLSASKTKLEVVINKCFFKGSYYEIEGIFNNNATIYFNHSIALKKEKRVYLKLLDF